MPFRHLAILAVLALSACVPRVSGPVGAPPQYLYLWTGSDDATQPDFLAVLDVTENGARYGRLVTTLPGGADTCRRSSAVEIGELFRR
jgi:hypothetical protein